MTRAALAALLLAGCETPDPVARLEACTEPTCQAEAISAAWDADPEATWAFLTAQQDDLTLAGLVARLASERPGALEGRCQRLPQGGPRKRCNRLTQRPHLRSRHTDGAPGPSRPRLAAGPRSGALPLPPHLPSVEPPHCDEFEPSECAFRAAERLALGGDEPALRRALALCGLSDHGPDCVEHVLELAMPPVPPADAANATSLAEAARAATLFGSLAGDEAVAALYEDWFWSVWTSTAVASAGELRGELLEALPAAAAPHLRFALAWQMLRRSEGPPGDDDALLAALEEILATRAPLPADSGPLQPAVITETRHGWSGERRGEGAIPAAYCMGSTRRALDDDPALDLRMALLEALARLPAPPPAARFLALVGSDEPELLRWTGARLGTMLDAEAAEAMLGAQADPSPLVTERLRPEGKQQRSPPLSPERADDDARPPRAR